MEVKAVLMRYVIVNSHHPKTFHLSECLQQVGRATTIASRCTYKWTHGVPFNHTSALTNLASSLRMEHVCQSSQTRLQHHQKCSEKYVVPASQPTAFAHHVGPLPASRIDYLAACTANEDNVRTAARFPIGATNESVQFAQQVMKTNFNQN